MAKFVSLSGLARFKSKLPAFIASEGFIKNTVDNLVNYYKKAETYTQDEVNALISAAKSGSFKVVDVLPEASADTLNAIYLVPKTGAQEKNIKDEYVTIDKGEGEDPRYVWEKIGDTTVDLSNYYTKGEVDGKVATINEAIASANTNIANNAAKIATLEADVTSIEADVAEKVADVTVDGTSVVGADHIAVLETATDDEIDALFA